MNEKYICIKKVLLSDTEDRKYELYFQIGKIYDFVMERYGGDLPVFTHKNSYYLSTANIDDFFIPLDEWRELRINKILENG